MNLSLRKRSDTIKQMKKTQWPAAAFAVWFFALSLSAGERDVADILGATHMNPLYSFTEKPVLEEGADVLRNMGSRAIKLWYGPDYATNYPQNHSWPVVGSLTELAQTETFQTLFGDPDFRVYALQAATFNYRHGWQYGDFSSAESNAVFAEVYDLAAFLLTNFNQSGKTFIVQNWEGDNALGQDASAERVQSMIDWLNCRQDAVSAARNDLSGTVSNVWVYGAAECNKVGQPDWSGPRCITNVFPSLHMDLYSYSDWYTRESEEKLLEDLNAIKLHAPDSDTFGHENVFLGEFGLNRMNNGEAGNLLASRTELEIGMDCGARFAFYWQVYDQTDTNQSHGVVLNAERAGLFGETVDHTGRYYTQTYHYFKTNALLLDVFEDLAEDFSECAGYSNITVNTALQDHMDKDPGRFGRSTTGTGLLEYSLNRSMRRLAIQGYQYGGDNNITVLVSKTGAAGSYTNVPLRKIQNNPYPGTDWKRVLYKNQTRLGSGYRYVKVLLDGATHSWTPQVAAVRFFCDRPAQVKTIQFGGLVSHMTDTNHQAQVGADELIQWNGVDNRGATFGENGTLHTKDAGAFIESASTGLQMITAQIASTDAEGTNTFTSGGVLGITGGDNAKFDAANSEALSFEFNRPVLLRQLLFAALDFDVETALITINGTARSFTRVDALSEPAGWDVNRTICSFSPPVSLAAGAAVSVAATQGQWALEGVVVDANGSAFELWKHLHGIDTYDNPDGDALDSLAEFALGGDPHIDDAQAVFPKLGKPESGSFQGLEFSFRRRIGESNLVYRLRQSGSLVSNVWNAAAGTPAVSGLDANFENIAYPVAVDAPQQFFRLQIEEVE